MTEAIIPLPKGPFKTVVADPPWPYRDRLPGGGRGAKKHYNLMSIDEIKGLSPFIQQVLEPNAHLYLWTTNGFVKEAWDVAWDWGFKPKTLITWVKTKGLFMEGLNLIADGSGIPHVQLGMGHYYRGATEQVIFAVRGRLPTLRKDIPTVFFAPRGSHSTKPQELYDIVQECSPGRYLELFARKNREDWEVWGDEIPTSLPMVDVPDDEFGRVVHTSGASAVEQAEREYDG